jgi:hypothetical protein
MPRFPVSITLNIPMSLLPLRAEDLPNLSSAVEGVAAHAQGMWRGYAGGSPLPDGSTIQARSGRYLDSIQILRTGPFSAETYSDLPYARIIEEGAPARDLKKMLDTSMKVRMSKQGKRYLIVPFRWGIPGTKTFGRNVMPEAVHEFAKAMDPSRVIGIGTRESGNGSWDVNTRAPMRVAQRVYMWGGRLKEAQVNQAGVFGTAAKRMAGMVKFQNPGEGSRHTQYLTFRVMVEGGRGWIASAIAGKHPARTVADKMRPVAEKIFSEALAADVRAAMGQT